MNVRDKVVVITGGSQGFGKGLAAALQREGAHVVISSNDQPQLEATAKELSMDFFVADVTSFDQVAELAKHAIELHKRIDVWVNNAGIQIAPSVVEAVDIAKLHALFDINFFGYFYGCKAVVPILKSQGEGTLININSTAGLGGKPGLSAYVSSKFAIRGLTETLRAELAGDNIQVYGVFPGGMQTDIYKEQYPADFNNYMPVDYAIAKVIDNLKQENPEADLVIKRPAAKQQA